MKTLIIGSKGMLGRALVEVFSNDHEVLAWDHGDVDITEAQSAKRKIKNERPDIVINAAAYTDVDGAENEPDKADLLNGRAVGYLANICSESGVPLVHYSTDYVFDGKKKEGYTEGDEPKPVSAYGKSKYLGEVELQKNIDKYYLIRLSKLFGKPGSGKKSFVELMLQLAKTRDKLEVVDEELSCPTYANDLAERTRYIVDNKLPYGIYHGVNLGATTWYGLASEVFKIREIDVKLQRVMGSHFPRPAKRPEYGELINTKLPPARPWQEALREFLTNFSYD